MDLKLLPCAGCKEAKVLKLGDYCVACSLEWPDNENYIIVKPDTLEAAVMKSGLAGDYLRAKSDHAFERYQTYVIYEQDGEWKEITINDKFPVPFVMKNLLAKGANPNIREEPS